jgi:hypothetical protein
VVRRLRRVERRTWLVATGVVLANIIIAVVIASAA